ncbi:MAG: hypothetical protein HXX81_05945 [Campylobacterales bacterium]|nr:hypothetical protein [Campylobacterales bacterium]
MGEVYDRYKSLEEYDFVVKLSNKPISNVNVTLTTKDSQIVGKTDKNGVVSFILPDDIKDDFKKGSYFNLETSFENYTTTLSLEYFANPSTYRYDRFYGLVTIFLGLLIGFLIYRVYFKKEANG